MHYDTDIWRAVEQLGDLAVCAARRMPRDLKPVLGVRIVEETGYMAILVREAAMAKGRAKVPLYEQLLAGVALTQFLLERAFNNKGLGPRLYARCVPVTVSIGRQANALRGHFASAP
jgi:hypothetical protein